MKFSKVTIMIALIFSMFASINAQEFGLGADVVSRYVWRGADFGNTAAVQPSLSFTSGPIEIGAWGSYSLTPANGGYENDLYISFSQDGFSFTITDYYFPNMAAGQDEFFKFGEDDGIHFLEASAGYSQDAFSIMAGIFFLNDTDNSLYFEAGYEAYNKDDVVANVFIGAGNGIYTLADYNESTMETDTNKFNLVNIGITVAKGMFSSSYILNPDRKIAYLVFSASL